MVEERNESRKIVKRYPLDAKIGKNVFDCKPEFLSTKNSKICEKAYKLIANLQSTRDLCKEYIAARVWPLKKGWSFIHFHKKAVRGRIIFILTKKLFARRSIQEMKFLFLLLKLSQIRFWANFSRKRKI
jgi:hypothetical protein